ncbi:MAG: hypothetical protein A2X86_03165 [Bdellovibrionales bacterium GWA2_49_15]|nr:MAG: hypothetical protein A2X86_03165 [Bdellovibrionales bacterium GWA2_49_15]HAZ12214.1 hypothetical protein [Bdellovibrionales bacterium]
MDMGHTLGKASLSATNVVDLSAYRLQKQKDNSAKQESLSANVPNEIHSIISELSEVVKEGERKFKATL